MAVAGGPPVGRTRFGLGGGRSRWRPLPSRTLRVVRVARGPPATGSDPTRPVGHAVAGRRPSYPSRIRVERAATRRRGAMQYPSRIRVRRSATPYPSRIRVERAATRAHVTGRHRPAGSFFRRGRRGAAGAGLRDRPEPAGPARGRWDKTPDTKHTSSPSRAAGTLAAADVEGPSRACHLSRSLTRRRGATPSPSSRTRRPGRPVTPIAAGAALSSRECRSVECRRRRRRRRRHGFPAWAGGHSTRRRPACQHTRQQGVRAPRL